MKKYLSLVFIIFAFCGVCNAEGCNTKIAAWYASSSKDIDDLESKKFNLFFFNLPNYDRLGFAERNSVIDSAISSLSGCSKIVLPIDNFLNINWYSNEGMQAFVLKWGSHPKVHGFLLKDDVVTSPFPSESNINKSALWVYRWYYRMIRNRAEDQKNSYNRDLAQGKKIFVTLPFQYLNEAGVEVKNNINRFHFAINEQYAGNIPPDFFIPGEAWDVVMPYWYPHRARISMANEEYIMGILYKEMSEAFPSGSRMPIIQTAAETSNGEYFYLEHEESHGYDLSIQYNKFISNNLTNYQNRDIAYYSANGHSTVYDNLLHVNYVRNATDSNIYFREAGIINAYHLQLFGM